jgi:hypothetical protein
MTTITRNRMVSFTTGWIPIQKGTGCLCRFLRWLGEQLLIERVVNDSVLGASLAMLLRAFFAGMWEDGQRMATLRTLPARNETDFQTVNRHGAAAFFAGVTYEVREA